MDQPLIATLACLRDAAELYRQLATAERHQAQAASRTVDLEAAVAEWDDDIAASAADGRRRQRDTIGLEDELEAIETKLRDCRSREARDATTAQALADQLEALQRRRVELEARLIERWQQDDRAAADRTAEVGAAAAARARLSVRQADLEQRRQRAERAVPEILAELEQLRGQLPARVGNRLAQVARRHADPVADLAQGACGGCGQRLTPQEALAVEREAQLLACQGCGRFVVSRSSRRTR